MFGLSNLQALSRAQTSHDLAGEYDYRPDPVLEERDERIRVLENNQSLLIHELREAADRLNRTYPCAGDRFTKTCNQIEGIQE